MFPVFRDFRAAPISLLGLFSENKSSLQPESSSSFLLYQNFFRVSAIAIGNFSALRVSAHQASRGHREPRSRAASDDVEGATKAEAAIELLAHEPAAKNREGEAITWSGDRFHASSFSRGIDPVDSSFRCTLSD